MNFIVEYRNFLSFAIRVTWQVVREFIKELSQKALDLGVNGLIIESHCNPDVALSDAKQQLTPHDLNTLLHELVIRNLPAPRGLPRYNERIARKN
jgi:hypothetical protein